MKYKVILTCGHCNEIINETKPVDKELADKIYMDALTNPLVGWCRRCDAKPMPKIVEVKE